MNTDSREASSVFRWSRNATYQHVNSIEKVSKRISLIIGAAEDKINLLPPIRYHCCASNRTGSWLADEIFPFRMQALL